MHQALEQDISPFNVRKRSFQIFDDASSTQIGSARRWLMRAQNFIVEWLQVGSTTETIQVESKNETMVLMPDRGGVIHCAGKPAVHAAAGTVCIVPAGPYSIALEQGASYGVIASSRTDINMDDMLNAAAYVPPDPRIDPIRTPYRRQVNQGEVQVLQMDEIASPADKPRLKIIQTETLSINWVAYEGPRKRSQLTPHKHASYEQGSLAIRGNYQHHLRVQWGNDANLWQDDEHCAAPSPSLLVIPVHLIHTSEGVGDDAHLLIDIFSPPRADFIAKGWVYNAGDYAQDQ